MTESHSSLATHDDDARADVRGAGTDDFGWLESTDGETQPLAAPNLVDIDPSNAFDALAKIRR